MDGGAGTIAAIEASEKEKTGIRTLKVTKDSMESFSKLNQPPLSPPGWIFPVVWIILYTLMGISSYLILTSDAKESEKQRAMKLYGYQLAVNFLWCKPK